MKYLITYFLLSFFLLFGLVSPISYAAEMKKDVRMELVTPEQVVEKGKEIKVGVKLVNPSKMPISSFLSVIKYDEKILKGLRIEPTEGNIFDINLYANDETSFLHQKGIGRMGRATISDVSTLPDSTLMVGYFVFQVLETPKDMLPITFVTESSTNTEITGVQMNNNGIVENILDLSSLHSISLSPAQISSKPVLEVKNTTSSVLEKKPTKIPSVSILPTAHPIVHVEDIPKTPDNGPEEVLFWSAVLSLIFSFFITRHLFRIHI